MPLFLMLGSNVYLEWTKEPSIPREARSAVNLSIGWTLNLFIYRVWIFFLVGIKEASGNISEMQK